MVVRSVLSKSIKRARKFITSPGRDWDPYYFSSRIRYEARQLFKAQSLDASEDGDETSTPSIESNLLPNIGIQFFRSGVLAKVLKRSSDPEVPLPVPHSKKRIAFYNQQFQAVPHPRFGNQMRQSEWNTVYLWDYNEDLHFSSLALACPRKGGNSKQLVDWHWIVDIPILSTAQRSNVSYRDDRQQTLIDDVPIGLPEDDLETGTNQTS